MSMVLFFVGVVSSRCEEDEHEELEEEELVEDSDVVDEEESCCDAVFARTLSIMFLNANAPT